MAGTTYNFTTGELLIDYALQQQPVSAATDSSYGGSRIWRLTISAVPNPDSVLIAGEVSAPSVAAAATNSESGFFLLASSSAAPGKSDSTARDSRTAVTTSPIFVGLSNNFSNSSNSSVSARAPASTSGSSAPSSATSSAAASGFELGVPFRTASLIGSPAGLQSILDRLSYTAPTTAGTSVSTRQTALVFSLTLLQPDGTQYSAAEVRTHNPAGTLPCKVPQLCACQPGWFGSACDSVPGLMVVATVMPNDPAERVVWRSTGRSGPQIALTLGGHGTHTAISVAGKPLLNATDSLPTDMAALGKSASVSSGAHLAVVDIGMSGWPYLTPPATLGESLMGRAYDLAGARVFLAPWTCEATAGGCSGYGSSAWEVRYVAFLVCCLCNVSDEYLHSLLVRVPSVSLLWTWNVLCIDEKATVLHNVIYYRYFRHISHFQRKSIPCLPKVSLFVECYCRWILSSLSTRTWSLYFPLATLMLRSEPRFVYLACDSGPA